MTNLNNAKWDFSKEEKYAIEWLEKNGYDVTLEKQYVSKTVFSIEKDNIRDSFELPQGDKNFNVKKYMEQFSKQWTVLCELQELRKQAGK